MVLKHVFIMSGIPGSGKSTLWSRMRAALMDASPPANPLRFNKVSADDFFTGVDGIFRYVPADIGKAHQACFREFIECIQAGLNVICVDNTNCNSFEIAPYYLAAESFGYKVTVVRIDCDPVVAFARQIHNVPHSPHGHMSARFRARDVLPWWNVISIKDENDRDLLIKHLFAVATESAACGA